MTTPRIDRRPPTAAERNTAKQVASAAAIFTTEAQGNALMRLFTKINTILVGKVIATGTDAGLSYPAMTDGKEIKFSDTYVAGIVSELGRGGRLAKVAAASVRGINYHELAHVLFSPNRTTSPYATALATTCASHPDLYSERDCWLPANLIEDQRIETLFSALYTGSRSFFRASTLHTLLNDGQTDPASSFLWTHGRRYLPLTLRRAHRAAAVQRWGQSFVDQWRELIDEYVTLNLETEYQRAVDITIAVTLLMRDAGVTPPPSDHQTRPGTDKSKTTKNDSKRAEAAADAAKREQADDAVEDERLDQSAEAGDDAEGDDAAGADPGDDAADDGAADEAEDAADEAEAEGDGDGDGEGDDGEPDSGTSEGAEGADGSEGDDGDDDGEAGDSGESGSTGDSRGDEQPGDPDDGEVTSSQNAGTGAGGTTPAEPQTAAEALDQLLNDVKFDREVSDMLREYVAETEKGDIERPRKTVSGNPYPVHAETLGLSNKIYHVLQRMRADSGDVHESRMESGRVNVLDFATRKPWEMDFFDHHEEGRADEFDMEVVILLDLSPSMIGMASTASSALWQIKHAMSRFGVRVTAYGYNDGKAKCLYGPGDATSSTRFESFQAGGSGTDPLDALTRAYNILSRTDSHRRVLFTITDGEWNWNVRHQCDAIVEKINGLRNATTILVGLESSYASSASGVIRHDDRSTYHCHHIARSVDEPAKIVDIFKDFVYHVARQR